MKYTPCNIRLQLWCLVCVCVHRSSLQEQKEDLRKRLSYTTHKLELLESEFDSTRQYLETELRRAQEELDKFTDKLRRYAKLQNHTLMDLLTLICVFISREICPML